MTDDEKAQAETASWRAWQTAWGNTESGAHAHGWENGYQTGFEAGRVWERARAPWHSFIPLSGSQDTGGTYTRCSVAGCSLTPDQHRR